MRVPRVYPQPLPLPTPCSSYKTWWIPTTSASFMFFQIHRSRTRLSSEPRVSRHKLNVLNQSFLVPGIHLRKTTLFPSPPKPPCIFWDRFSSRSLSGGSSDPKEPLTPTTCDLVLRAPPRESLVPHADNVSTLLTLSTDCTPNPHSNLRTECYYSNFIDKKTEVSRH